MSSFARNPYYSVREPSEILDAVVPFFSSAGWAVASRSRRDVTFASEVSGAKVPVAILLLLIGLLPGILYLLFAKEMATISVSSRVDDDGSITTLTWSEGQGRKSCEAFWRMLEDQEPMLDEESEEDRLPQPIHHRYRQRRSG